MQTGQCRAVQARLHAIPAGPRICHPTRRPAPCGSSASVISRSPAPPRPSAGSAPSRRRTISARSGPSGCAPAAPPKPPSNEPLPSARSFAPTHCAARCISSLPKTRAGCSRCCAPRTLARNAQRLKNEHGIDSRLVARSRKVLIDALHGGACLSRPELYRRLDSARIPTSDGRGLQLLWWHAHEGLVCLGPRAGKQQTVALLDEWLPATPPRSREESLAELARRYFMSHGPATVRDFAWWSGLAGTDAALALEMVAKELHAVKVDEQTYWQAPDAIAPRKSSGCHLLPAYDEYTVAYQDRSAVMSNEIAARADSGHGIFHPPIVIDGQIAGTWTRDADVGRDYLAAFRATRSPADAGARDCGAALREVPRSETAGSSLAASRRSQSMNAAAAGVGRRCAGCTT